MLQAYASPGFRSNSGALFNDSPGIMIDFNPKSKLPGFPW